MNELLESYSKECSFISKGSHRLWLVGEIISVLGFGIYFMIYKKIIIPSIILIFFIIVLRSVCDYLELKGLCKKLMINVNILKIIFKKTKRKQIYNEMDKYQKNWTTCYCKKHKLNSIKKLEIIKDELNRKISNNNVKFLNPVIIGTLVLSAWNEIIPQMYKETELDFFVIAVIILAIIISILIGNFTAQYKKQCEFMKMYSKYHGNDRLNELLVYEMLRCKR